MWRPWQREGAVCGKLSRTDNIHQYVYHQIYESQFFDRKRIVSVNNKECHPHCKYHR